jgi:AraC-like DNA-binding protein
VRILDTTTLPVSDRAAAFHAAIESASVPCLVIHDGPAELFQARLDLYQLGTATVSSTASGTGIRLLRTPRHLRQVSPHRLAVAWQITGFGRYEQAGRYTDLPAGRMIFADLSGPYDFSWSGRGAATSLQLGYDELGVSVDTVRLAQPGLRHSPLYGLVATHIRRLTRDAEQIGVDPGLTAVLAATTDLIRALAVSAAARGDQEQRAVLAQTLLTRVQAYIRQHLTEPGLTPDRIAAAHNISERYLYRLFATSGTSLEQWIIESRLAGARTQLASPAGNRRSITAVAHGWGFTSAAHFSRRFRAAYGASPRQWQQLAQQRPANDRWPS